MDTDELYKRMYEDYLLYTAGKIPFLTMFERWETAVATVSKKRADQEEQIPGPLVTAER